MRDVSLSCGSLRVPSLSTCTSPSSCLSKKGMNMMRSVFLRYLLISTLTAAAANSALAEWNATPETIEEHPTWIYTPSTAMPDGKHPLLIALHGCAQTHTEIKNFGNLAPTAEKNGIVVAVSFVGSEFFGSPLQMCWDYDRANDAKGHIDELVKLANNLKSRSALSIDQNHVYIVGLSSGAAMALAVGCKAPDVF